MKIRNSLVSNSSSASYIIEIKKMDMDTFSSLMLSEYSYDLFSVEEILKKINMQIEDYRNRLTQGQSDQWFKDWLKDAEKQKEKFEKLLKSDSTVERVKTVLDYHGIEYTEKDNNLTLKSFTSMHNSFDEGLCPIMKEVALYFMFEDNYELIAKVDHD